MSLSGLKTLDALAQHYSCRPSALVGERDSYVAYCLDEAALLAALRSERAESTDGRQADGKQVYGTIGTLHGIAVINSGPIPMLRRPEAP